MNYFHAIKVLTFYFDMPLLAVKQRASRFMLIFMKILKMYVKVKYFEVNKESNLHVALTVHENFQKEVKICKNSTYCVSHTQINVKI
jgi:hypothetical protein